MRADFEQTVPLFDAVGLNYLIQERLKGVTYALDDPGNHSNSLANRFPGKSGRRFDSPAVNRGPRSAGLTTCDRSASLGSRAVIDLRSLHEQRSRNAEFK